MIALRAALAVIAIAAAGVSEPTLLWKGPAMPGWREMDEVEVHGVIEDGRFRPQSLAVPEKPPPATPPLVPLGSDILPLARHRAFGVENRVSAVMRKDGLEIACKRGSAPAGVVLDWPDRSLPTGYRGRWSLSGAGSALGLSAVGAGRDASAEPQARLTGGAATLLLRRGAQQIVITCGPDAAITRIGSVAIVADRAATGALPRGTWVWRESEWRTDPATFAQVVAEAGWTEVAVQAPAQPDAALDSLSRAFAAHNLTLRLVDGDPAMATAEGLPSAVARFTALRAWCDRHWGAPQRPQLELDIEPYGRAEFARDPAAAWRGWAEAIRAVSRVWGAPVSVDVPWWMLVSPGGGAALTQAGAAIGDIVVMAYRTDPQLIVEAAAPWLAQDRWPVRIAIERGPVAPEAARRYRSAASGPLRLDDVAAELFDAPVGSNGQNAVFAFVAESVTDPARISFHDAPARAAAVEQRLVPLLAGWPRFGGWRVHGWTAPLPAGR